MNLLGFDDQKDDAETPKEDGDEVWLVSEPEESENNISSTEYKTKLGEDTVNDLEYDLAK